MKRHSYPSDLSDEQCKRIERLLPAPKPETILSIAMIGLMIRRLAQQ